MSMSIKFFGQFLLERAVISPAELLEAVQHQESRNRRIGEYAVQKGYLTKKDVDTILAEQKRTDMQFGELAVHMKILTPGNLEELLTLQKNDHILLGEALIEKGFITRDALDSALALFRHDQSQYVPGEVLLPESVANPLVMRDFVDLTEKMFLRVAHLRVKAGEGVMSSSAPQHHDITICIRLDGSLTYEYILSASLTVSTLIASGIIGENAAHETREVIVDGVKEFCNIVCGNMLAKLAQRGQSLNITAPEEILSPAEELGNIRSKKAVFFNLSSVEGEIALILVQGR
jgi:CheY-specific phosphatase CheX